MTQHVAANSPEAHQIENVTGEDPSVLVPIPVEVVAPVRVVDRPARLLTTDQAYLPAGGTVPARLASERLTRDSLVIAPRGAAIWLGGTPGVTMGTGFYVGDGGAVTLDTTAAVYAISDPAGAAVTVYTLAQVREG